jgi:flagellin-like protein
MRIRPPTKRKAISPVLATVILIAITLIAAIAVAGFVFGLFGTFTSVARVQASVTGCGANGASPNEEACTLILTNSGNANTATTGICSLTFGGTTYSGLLTNGGTVPSGGSLSSPAPTCTVNSAASHLAGAGVQVTGSVILANGGNALFSATASS